jgi:GntP family gluconate:H+ symporter
MVWSFPLVGEVIIQASPTASPSLLAANILISVAIVLILIGIFDIGPSVSLVIGSLYMGIASNLGLLGTVNALSTGFGNLMSSIGIPIIFGIMIGTFLAECGGARKIATTLLQLVPSSYVPYAIGFSGLIVSIPVFFDVTFLVLAPVAVTVWRGTDISYPMIIGPLAIGAGVAHTLVPPTPNPLAAPDIIGFPLGNMIIAGLIIGPIILIATIAIYRRIIGILWVSENDIHEIPFEEDQEEHDPSRTPSFVASVIPITIPLILILFVTVSKALTGGASMYVQFLGSRIMALLAGLIAAIFVYISVEGRDALSDQFSESLEPIGLVLAITGAGGAFGYVIQQTGAADALVNLIGISDEGISIIIFAYVMGLFLRVAQGSGTVAGITTMTIVAGIETTVPGVALAIASLSGGLGLGHINDSGFWVATEIAGLEVSGGLKTYTLGETIASVFGFVSALVIVLLV